MATRKNNAPQALSADLYDILAQFSDARAFLEIAYTALDIPSAGNGTVCMPHGLRLLKAAYRELDTTITGMGSNGVA